MLSARAWRGTGMDDDVCLGQSAMHSVGRGAHQLAGMLKGEQPRQRERQVGKVAAPARRTRACSTASTPGTFSTSRMTCRRVSAGIWSMSAPTASRVSSR